MVKCEICGKEYKKLTASHLKTHNITYDEYLKEYEFDKYYLKRGAELLDDLYITVRSSWLLQTKNSYITLKKGRDRKWSLQTSDVRDHLEGKNTLGIFFPKGKSKVIGLDLDEKDEELLERVYNAVGRFIPQEAILTSYSGNKGYHIDIFISEMLPARKIKEFYQLILDETDLNKKILELRGVGDQGYKLPLGNNAETDNHCSLVNSIGTKIKSKKIVLDKLENIVPVASELILEAIEINEVIIFTDEDEQEIEEIMEEISPLESYKNPVENIINNHWQNGIEEKGRHNAAFILALAYKKKGLCSKEIFEELMKWHKTLDSSKYTSTPEEIRNDYEEIIKYIYERDYNLPVLDVEKEAIISREDLKLIFSVDGRGRTRKALRKLLFALIVHAKMYANTEGVFYMTYEQMNSSMNTDNNRFKMRKWLDELEDQGSIEIVASNRTQEGTFKKLPNKYKVLGLSTGIDKVISQAENNFKICDKKEKCKNCLYTATCSLYTEKEIKSKFSYRQGKKILASAPCPYNSIAQAN